MYEEYKIWRRCYVNWLTSHNPLAEPGEETRYLFKDIAIFTILFCLLIILPCSFLFLFYPFPPLYFLVSSCLVIFPQEEDQLLSTVKFIGDKVGEKYVSKWISCVPRGISSKN